MSAEKVIKRFINIENVKSSLKLLSTSSWSKLTDDQKKSFFTSLNNSFCAFLGIERVKLFFDNNSVVLDYYDGKHIFSNIRVEDDKFTIINLNYNQYLILYEYFYRIREIIQINACYGDNEKKYRDSLKRKWIDNLRVEEFGDICVDFFVEEGEYLYDYQEVAIDAREYAETILFEIVRLNYDINNSYDEQYFMARDNILMNNELVKIGKSLLKKQIAELEDLKDSLVYIKDIVYELDNSDLSSIEEFKLYVVVYPDVARNVDVQLIVKVYQEIVNRYFTNSIDIKYKKKNILFNDNVYSIKDFKNNSFNIFLYEILRSLDNELKNKYGDNKDLIIENKRKFLNDFFEIIDSNLENINFGVIKYQPLSLLVKDDNFYSNLKSSRNGKIPLKVRRK